ncbi:protein LAZY 1-like [Rutidosis leptorrhynchoides]|uniref:protein LAZY 1-like n=1 Tax=Rutidosis leptorrhynchoides TaxID=125765 RepID=UPI003A9A65AC
MKLLDWMQLKFRQTNNEPVTEYSPRYESVVCPLQDYLLGTMIRLPETATKKKEHRTTLGELFERTTIVKEIDEAKRNKRESEKKYETENSTVRSMIKILKGKTLYSSSRHHTTEKKSHKILRLLHRKVHPEGLLVAPKSEIHSNEEYQKRNRTSSDYITLIPMPQASKNCAECINKECCRSSDSDGNKECWIKSDAEYLVLEL